MPDLVTHLSAAALLRRLAGDRQTRLLFLLGAVLPDLFAKTCHVVLRSPVTFAEAAHAPTILALECLAVAYMFPHAARGRAWRALYMGGLLHVLMDLAKDHMGQGNVLFGFPFTAARVEVPLYMSEDAIFIAPMALAVFLVAEAITALRRSRP